MGCFCHVEERNIWWPKCYQILREAQDDREKLPKHGNIPFKTTPFPIIILHCNQLDANPFQRILKKAENSCLISNSIKTMDHF